jgi:ribonuclease T2
MTRFSRLRSLNALLMVAFIATGLFALPGQALAQREVKGGPAGTFDFYVLALSWSPGFCELEGDNKGRDQCDVGRNLGFVVHGLWPQFETGYPTECGPGGRTPSRTAMAQAAGVFPAEALARYQWRKHGVCSGSSPSDYFADVKRAREAVVVPAELQKPDRSQTWAPIDIERAFVASNPGLRADMISVACKRSTLQEVRICFSKDLRRFVTCQEVDRGGCRTREVKVPPLR